MDVTLKVLCASADVAAAHLDLADQFDRNNVSRQLEVSKEDSANMLLL